MDFVLQAPTRRSSGAGSPLPRAGAHPAIWLNRAV